MRLTTALWAIAAFLACATASRDKKIICYFSNWSVYRQGNGQFDVSHIDPSLCTHLVYSYAGLTSDGEVKSLDPNADLPIVGGKDGYNRFNRLRNLSPNTKFLIAVGGWNEGSTIYSEVAANPTKRRAFIVNAISFIRHYGFDGLSFDWQYPNQRGGIFADKKNYIQLLKELREEFDRTGLLLMATVGAVYFSAEKSYIISEMVKYLDVINLMTYDFHGSWDMKTGANSPLYSGYWETGDNSLLNINETVNYWFSNGAPANKLILGIPTYGRSFKLENYLNNYVGAPTIGAGLSGPYTKTPGTLGYNEICESFKYSQWSVHFEKEQKVPFAYLYNQWIGYDDPESVKEKAAFIRSYGLGGAMIYSIETDDFRGICGEKYPLLKTLNRALYGYVPPQPPVPTTIATPKPGEIDPCDLICREAGHLRDPINCSIYYICEPLGQSFIRRQMYCPSGLVFDLTKNLCNWRDQVDCKGCKL